MDLEYDETYLHDSVIVDKIKKSFGVIEHCRASLLFSLVWNPTYSVAFAPPRCNFLGFIMDHYPFLDYIISGLARSGAQNELYCVKICNKLPSTPPCRWHLIILRRFGTKFCRGKIPLRIVFFDWSSFRCATFNSLQY